MADVEAIHFCQALRCYAPVEEVEIIAGSVAQTIDGIGLFSESARQACQP